MKPLLAARHSLRLSLQLRWTPRRPFSQSAALSVPNAQSIHIHNEKLCDALLDRLAPTFQPRAPLDIIDLFPGVGIWSSKVHQRLRPRRHLLLEPLEKDYAPHLRALVNSDPSYKFLPWDPLDEASINSLFSPQHLPEQLQRDLGPQGATQFNPSLLVLANMTRHRHSYSKRVFPFLRYLEACFDQSLLHQRGLVRIISIFTSSDAATILPRNLFGRRRLSVIAEAASAELVQLAGDTHESNHAAIKGEDLWQISARAAAARAKAARISTPRGRQVKPIERAPEPFVMNSRRVDYFKRPKHDWHDNYLAFLKEYQEYHKDNPDAKGNFPDREKAHRFILYRKRLLLENREAPLVAECVNKQLAIDDIQAQLRTIMHAGKPYPPNTPDLVATMDTLTSARDDIRSRLSRLSKIHVTQRVQETHALLHSTSAPPDGPPLLRWDCRPYEPLRTHPADFDPPIPCAIIDFRPDPSSLMLQTLHRYTTSSSTHKPPHDARTAYLTLLSIFRQLIRPISRGPARPIDRTLLRPLFPGRPMHDLIKAVPSLEQFAKITASYAPDDGVEKKKKSAETLRLEYEEDCLSDMSLRALPVAVLWDLAIEWERWPMRTVDAPELWKLLGGQGMDVIESTFTPRKV
ncbi:hypothetical protein PRK78_005444 [Emydomyces testavorans]|uniref:rRNA adenine N(6)-methyltransferase n=1 Tax=Emydomyces testavorans TaxID=2070801 RepID=A0AAF0DLQ8_9EURO|nr:hypothetical protein PRK78_005444 [Emydomyces testavorans]